MPMRSSANAARVEALVLSVHRRNGGKLSKLSWDWRLLEPALGIDSLDLAEIVAFIEKEFGVSPFDGTSVPKTWDDLMQTINNRVN